MLDNSSTRSTSAVHDWFAEHPDVSLHFTPKVIRGPNMVEAFGVLTRTLAVVALSTRSPR